MIDDIKMIEKMDEILDLTRGKNTPEQKLKDIEVVLRDTIKEAEGRVEETWLENERTERILSNL